MLIVGAGFTGLCAGLTLARAGRSVQIFDRQRRGAGASTRNGGIASGNVRPSQRQLVRKFGQARASALAAKAGREKLALFISVRRVKIAFASSYPGQQIFALAHGRLRRAAT